MAGLSLARLLAQRGQAFRIFESAPELKASNLAMTLDSAAAQIARLAGFSSIEDLRQRCSVDIPGDGHIGRLFNAHTGEALDWPTQLKPGNSGFRANNRRLRSLLAESLPIEYGAKLTGWRKSDGQVIAQIERHGSVEEIAGSLLVSCEGVHSQTRPRLLPKSELRVEPYVVIYGSFRVERETFDAVFSSLAQDNFVVGRTAECTTPVKLMVFVWVEIQFYHRKSELCNLT